MRAVLLCAAAFVAASASADRFTVPREAGHHLPSAAGAVTVAARFDDGEPVDVVWAFSYADARQTVDGLPGGMVEVLSGGGGLWRCPAEFSPGSGCVVNVKAPYGCLVRCGGRSVAVKASPELRDLAFAEGGELSIESSGPVEVDYAEVAPVEMFTVVTKGARGGASLRIRVVDDRTVEYSDGTETVRLATDRPTGGVLAEGAFLGGPFLSRKVGADVRIARGWLEPKPLAARPVKRIKSGADASKRGSSR